MFVFEYLRSFSVNKAGAVVGMTPDQSKEAMFDPGISEAIAEQMLDQQERCRMDSDWLLEQLGEMFRADIADIYTPGTNSLRPVHEWPNIWRRMSTGVKTKEFYEGSGQDRKQVGETVDLKILDRLRVLDMIGKHTDVRAFVERVEIASDSMLTDRLNQARKDASARNSPKLPGTQPKKSKKLDFM